MGESGACNYLKDLAVEVHEIDFTVGVLTKFEDSEGNVLGAMAYEHPPRT